MSEETCFINEEDVFEEGTFDEGIAANKLARDSISITYNSVHVKVD